MKITLVLLLCLAVLLAACTPTETPSIPAPAIEVPLKEFVITAYQFGFEPSNIEVKKGERVKLTFISRDVDHGVYIPDFERSVPRFVQGERKSVEFVADKTGTFPYICSVFCGKGHREMQGTIIVTE